MPWQLDGTFLRQNTDYTASPDGSLWQQDLSASIKIIASRHDFHDQDIGQGIEACLNIDGLNTMRAALDMGGFGITGLAGAVGLDDIPRYGQVAGSMTWEEFVPGDLILYDRDGSVIDTVNIPTAGGGGSGTVTAIYAGDGLTATADPIQTSGTIAMEVLGIGQAYTGGIEGVVIDQHGRVTQVTTGASSSTNLSILNHNSNTLDINSSTGNQVTLPTASSTLSGLMSGADKAKLIALAPGGVSSGEVSGFGVGFNNWTGVKSGHLYWQRVGDIVTIFGRINWSNNPPGDAGNNVSIYGLPYNVQSSLGAEGGGSLSRIDGVDFGASDGGNLTTIGLEGLGNTTSVGIYINFSLNGPVFPGESKQMAYSQMASTGYMDIYFSYRTDEPI